MIGGKGRSLLIGIQEAVWIGECGYEYRWATSIDGNAALIYEVLVYQIWITIVLFTSRI